MGQTMHSIDWHPIGQTSNQLILYHPPSHALSVQPHPEPGPSTIRPSAIPARLLLPYRATSPSTPIETIERERSTCPYCSQTIPGTPLATETAGPPTGGYFEILERAHEGSRPPSPRIRERSATPGVCLSPERGGDDEGDTDIPAKGYYERFFREECRLGMGAEGSVYLATHIIGGNVLGTYAVKKIAVGTSKEYLVRMLREVRLLEALRHPNIIAYHHSWIDLTRFSSFGPPITALHVLMMYATAGNLDTFLLTRSHAQEAARPDMQAADLADAESLGQLPKNERIKAFKKRRMSKGGNSKKEENRGVLLLGLEELVKLFGDVVEGLAFLHSNSVLHLDLKCSNVLLHWEEGKLIPKAMISDFGTSEEMLRGKRERTGHTGTMEYMAPETLVQDANGHFRPSDSHADMWSLGMILHKLLFLHLPYGDVDDFDILQAAIISYQGFVPTPDLVRSCERRHIPRDILLLLSKLVDINPESRPSAEKVRVGIRTLKKAAPSSGLSGMVTRFTRPFDLRRRDTSPGETRASWPDVSPVRPILALPSPEVEVARPLEYPENVPSNIPWQQFAYFALAAAKLLSLQPAISNIQLNPLIASGLIVLHLVTMLSLNSQIHVASTILHVALLYTNARFTDT